MTFSASLLRKAALLAVFALVAGAWSSTALAQTQQYRISGNARYQIGDGLPIPISFGQPPNGKVFIKPWGEITQTTGPDPVKMILPPGGASHPGNPQNIGLYQQNTSLFQVKTAIPLSGPRVTATLQKKGRLGAQTLSWCPGTNPPAAPNTTWDPGCSTAAAGSGLNGVMRYYGTANQFGGVNQGNVGGTANIGIRVGGTPPGVVTARFAIADPQGTGAQGATFNWNAQTPGKLPGILNGAGKFYANANGSLLYLTPSGTNNTDAGQTNAAHTYGAPWTTGSLSISVTAAVGATEKFLIKGFDNRVSGIGAISLVSGGISNRTVSGPNANRGWLNLTVGPVSILTEPIPALSRGGLAAAFGLLALAGGYALHRRSRS